MQFTIVVKKIDGNQQSKQGDDLVLSHVECAGGNVAVKPEYGYWRLRCKRCNCYVSIKTSPEGTAALYRSAIDGGKQTLENYLSSDTDEVIVQRKD